MRTGILGGSFDPPHKGHVLIAKKLLKILQLDNAILMPCFQHPFNKTLSSIKHRLAMAKLLEKKNIIASDFEINKTEKSYSIDTLNHLSSNNPNNTYYWIMGADQIKNFTKWKDWKNIIDKFGLIIIPRKSGDKINDDLNSIKKKVTHPEHIIFVNKKLLSPINISSTSIRERIKEKKSIAHLVPKKVEEYIIKHKLYS